MSRILLVESCPKDASTIEGLLESAGFQVCHVSSAETAIDRIENDRIDLVLTALRLPRMDGLELVEQCRRHHPTLPVVLATAHGSEELAVKALQTGAANYIPKEIIQRELVPALDEVLAATAFQQSHEWLQQCLKSNTSRYELTNDHRLLEPMCERIHTSLRAFLSCEEIELIRIDVALREALSNAIQHGNLEVDSALREHDDKPYFDLLEKRMRQRPYCERRIYVEITESRSEVVLVVRDEGPGFDPANIPPTSGILDLDRPSGRGLLLIRTFMDEVRHNERGNEITMIKRYEPASSGGVTNGENCQRTRRNQMIQL